MLKREKEHLRNAIEQIDIDLKFIDKHREKAQRQLDSINDQKQRIYTRLQNLEAWMQHLE